MSDVVWRLRVVWFLRMLLYGFTCMVCLIGLLNVLGVGLGVLGLLYGSAFGLFLYLFGPIPVVSTVLLLLPYDRRFRDRLTLLSATVLFSALLSYSSIILVRFLLVRPLSSLLHLSTFLLRDCLSILISASVWLLVSAYPSLRVRMRGYRLTSAMMAVGSTSSGLLGTFAGCSYPWPPLFGVADTILYVQFVFVVSLVFLAIPWRARSRRWVIAGTALTLVLYVCLLFGIYYVYD